MTTPQVLVTGTAQTTVEILATEHPSVIEVSTPGPQGPPGTALFTYVHQQQVPASTWVINHNLGFKPSVELLNSGSQEIEGDVVHTSINQVVISFTSSISGLARLI